MAIHLPSSPLKIDDLQDLKAGEASRTEILAWCLEHHFELVECDEGEQEEGDGDEDEDEGIEEKLGRARVVEALKVVSTCYYFSLK